MRTYTNASVSLPPLELSKLYESAVREVDFVGHGTKTASQVNLLHRRSVEISNSKDSDLSARGLHHRSREHFLAQVKQHSAVIKQHLRNSQSATTKAGQAILASYFGRAFAFERLGNLDRALADYTTCIRIQKTHAASYFNRANVLTMKQQYEAALADLDEAVNLDRSNGTYRAARALLLRKLDRFLEATSDVLMCRVIAARPEQNAQASSTSERPPLSASRAPLPYVMEDPLHTALQRPVDDRTPDENQLIYNFVCSVRYFQGIVHDRSVVQAIAAHLQLECYDKDELIFDEGDPGNKFYVILNGEVSIVKNNVQNGELTRTKLATLYRGDVFGETAIQNRGKRSAGIIATQPCQLVTLGIDDFLEVMDSYLKALQEEVKDVLSLCPVFVGWEPSKLDRLSKVAVLKTFESNREIIRLGDLLDSFYIVKQGVINVIKPTKRTLCVSHMREGRGNGASLTATESLASPGNWVLDRGWKDRADSFDGVRDAHEPEEPEEQYVNFVVGVLGSGQYFGELAILNPERGSPLIVKTCTNVETYCIPSSVMFELGAQFHPATMAALDESMNLYNTPGEKLAYYFRHRLSWEQKKCKLLNQLLKTG